MNKTNLTTGHRLSPAVVVRSEKVKGKAGSVGCVYPCVVRLPC